MSHCRDLEQSTRYNCSDCISDTFNLFWGLLKIVESGNIGANLSAVAYSYSKRNTEPNNQRLPFLVRLSDVNYIKNPDISIVLAAARLGM